MSTDPLRAAAERVVDAWNALARIQATPLLTIAEAAGFDQLIAALRELAKAIAETEAEAE